MSERPTKLSFAAARVVMAAGSLSLGEKLVWLDDRALDRGPEGTWLSAEAFARRWGRSLSRATVEEYRRRLVQLALHVKIPRPGARAPGWVATLPLHCVPRSDQPADEEVARCAAFLDAHVKANGGRGHGPISIEERTQLSLGAEPNVGRGEGGQGGGSLLASGREATLHLPAGEADGVGAFAPKAEEGDLRTDPRAREAFEASLRKLPADKAAKLRRIAFGP